MTNHLLYNALQTDLMAAATSMAEMRVLKQRVYRARRKEQGEETIQTSVKELLNLDLDHGELETL